MESIPSQNVDGSVVYCRGAGNDRKGKTSAVIAAMGGVIPTNRTVEECEAVGTFASFAVSDSMVPFMRRTIEIVERELGLHSYHMRVIPWFGGVGGGPGGRPHQTAEVNDILGLEAAQEVRRSAWLSGFLLYVVADKRREREVPFTEGMDSLDAPISYEDASGTKVEIPGLTVGDTLVVGREPEAPVRCGMDFQGRPCLVAVMSPASGNIRRQSELSDAGLAALWNTAGRAVEKHGGFEDMRLNAGTYQNVAHLHLKVYFTMQNFLKVWGNDPVFKRLREAGEIRKKSRA